MDIFDQVKKLLRDMETRERRSAVDLRPVQAVLLAELASHYSQCIKSQQWKDAHDCLVDMIQILAAMLAKPNNK